MKRIMFVLLGLSLAACSSNPSTQKVEASEAAPPPLVSASPQASPIASASQPQAGRTGTVTADSLNIRQSPDTTSPVLYRLPAGTAVEILGETARGDSLWYQIRPRSSQLPQTVGWAFSQYIRTGGASGSVSDRPPTTPPSNAQAYQDGYRLGYRDGQNFKRYNSGYNPDAALQAGSGNPDPAYDRAFRDGFYAGFDAGYYGRPYNATPGGSSQNPSPPSEPNVGNLTMTCAGTLSNGTGFTVYYTRESGFSRIELVTASGIRNSTNLTYSGKTEAQHGVWKGRLSESEVRVDHLSAAAPQIGNEIYVLYNQFTGRTTCR